MGDEVNVGYRVLPLHFDVRQGKLEVEPPESLVWICV